MCIYLIVSHSIFPATGPFTCPLCICEEDHKPRRGLSTPASRAATTAPILSPPCASQIPSCAMSDFLSKSVTSRLISELVKEPPNPGEAILHPRLSPKEAKALADTITIRVVSSTDCAGNFEPRTSRSVLECAGGGGILEKSTNVFRGSKKKPAFLDGLKVKAKLSDALFL